MALSISDTCCSPSPLFLFFFALCHLLLSLLPSLLPLIINTSTAFSFPRLHSTPSVSDHTTALEENEYTHSTLFFLVLSCDERALFSGKINTLLTTAQIYHGCLSPWQQPSRRLQQDLRGKMERGLSESNTIHDDIWSDDRRQ